MLEDIIKKIDKTRNELEESKKQAEIDRIENISVIIKEMSDEFELTWDLSTLSVQSRGEGSFGIRCTSFDSYNSEILKCFYYVSEQRWTSVDCDLDCSMKLDNRSLKDLNKVEAISSVHKIMALVYRGDDKVMSYIDRIRETFDKELSIKQSIDILGFMREGTVKARRSERVVEAFIKGQAQLDGKVIVWIKGFNGQNISCNKIQIRKNQSGTYTVDLIDDEGQVKSSSSRASEDTVTRIVEQFYN
jgi:hypothetical protein